jgi:hypothetical protein
MDNIKQVPLEAWLYIAGCFGGAARIVMGIKEDGVTAWGEAARIFVISAPMAVIIGQWTINQQGYPVSVGIASGYFAGIASLNIARSLATEGFRGVLEIVFQLRKRK